MSEIFEVSDKWVVSEEWVRDSIELCTNFFHTPIPLPKGHRMAGSETNYFPDLTHDCMISD